MAIDYTALNKTATDLITSFGQAVTFSRFNLGSYSPTAGFSSEGAATTYSAKIVLFDQRTEEDTESSVAERETKATMSSSTAPEIGDTATINSKKYRINEVLPVQPAAKVICYDLLLAS